MAEQLTFDLPVRTSRDRGDFFIAESNAVALAAVERWKDWPGRKMVLTGPDGSGKSHLVEVWATLSGAEIVPASALPDTETAALAGRSVAVEDADRVAGDDEAEAALFHLHNLVLAEGGAVLFTSRAAPSRWGLDLPDLASRIEGTPMVALSPPDDALISAVLVKLFDDRQIAVAPNLIAYLAPRLPRSLAAAQDFVMRLDALALAEKRDVTRALAARLLDSEGGEGS
ncbi:DnaA/Hda family protein [Maritimibacter sp. UBA3975]|uniref:DnaA ATPase domain-containing protein n=1 Tax=Maritimibacter sp. UBA3975 TaxID=1946833 RepID=UPI000C0A846E|nr:DnaA/Hda family protein [Maritimibacter sp. UBA3975]MAM62647.1 chromosomal replication initiator DnaA [Maritimibacter sp.]|tara:strand:+ start:28029 stop:28712 length:684 start_codon:yes stop_codon:yes gene_type:complete